MFVSLGSAAENIEAAVDYLREQRGAKVGSIHLNVFRPFPEAAVVKALAGKKNVIILERTDEPMAGDNPMGRDIRTALNKALQGEAGTAAASRPTRCRGSSAASTAWARATSGPSTSSARTSSPPGTRARKDGKSAADGVSFIVLGVDHPYEVKSDETPSLLPEGVDRRALPLRRRLGRHHDRQEPGRDHRRPERPALRARQGRRRVRQSEGNHPRQRQPEVRVREEGRADLLLHGRRAGAHPRELRSAPRHRRALLRPEGVHAHQSARRHGRGRLPRVGVGRGRRAGVGAAARCGRASRSSTRRSASSRCPGFEIARKATDRGDLQLRMQGNAFLGAFFAVSPLLEEFRITPGAVPRGGPQAVREEVRPAGRRGREVQHGGHDAGLRAGARNPRSASSRRPIGPRCAARPLLPVVARERERRRLRLAAAARTRFPRARRSARR